jgi:uncharacterized membrane protein YebE (DUF533 family)
MGFLDRMVADMIGNATGLPVKGLVRRVGVKNLLLLGGAAAAAGAVAHKVGQSRSGVAPSPPTSSPVTGPHPPPPAGPSGQAQLPPLPPVPVSPAPVPPEPAPSDATSELEPDLTYCIVRTMVAAALADGEMAAEERQAIHSTLSDSGLGDERIRQIGQDLVLPATPEELAAMVQDPAQRPAVYRAAVLVTMADRSTNALESRWSERLALALGLDDEERQRLEADLTGV